MIRNFVWPSILETLLCNTFVCNVFTFTKEKDMPCHDDDNTIYTASSKTNMAIKKLEKCSERTEQNPISFLGEYQSFNRFKNRNQ